LTGLSTLHLRRVAFDSRAQRGARVHPSTSPGPPAALSARDIAHRARRSDLTSKSFTELDLSSAALRHFDRGFEHRPDQAGAIRRRHGPRRHRGCHRYGKTAAFLLPIIERSPEAGTRALARPTRGSRSNRELERFGRTARPAAPIIGGVDKPQTQRCAIAARCSSRRQVGSSTTPAGHKLTGSRSSS
jgi:hypothetical protein